jgi:hypothetical protein
MGVLNEKRCKIFLHPYKSYSEWLDRPNEDSQTNLMSKITKLHDVNIFNILII